MELCEEKNRKALATMLARLFHLWELTRKEQAVLLGYSPKSLKTVRRIHEGGPLTDKPDLLNRAGLLLSIYKFLHLIFPEDEELAYSWIKIPNKAFDGRRPLDVMSGSMEGLLCVRKYLEDICFR